MTTALVAGGAGFIGSHLVEALVAQGYAVTVLDDFSTGRIENLSGIDVEVIYGCVTDYDLVKGLVGKADYVFHLAAISGLQATINRRAYSVNAVGALNMARAWGETGRAKKVVFASSAAVYGRQPEPLQNEDMPAAPDSAYARSKWYGEAVWGVYAKALNAPMVSLRYFNVYGPRQEPNNGAVIPCFFVDALQGRGVTIHGDGSQTRDFVFVKDVVDGTILMANNGATGVFNIGTGRAVSIDYLGNLVGVAALTMKAPEYVTARSGDVPHSRADIGKAAAYGYKPSYCLEKGVFATYDHLKGAV